MPAAKTKTEEPQDETPDVLDILEPKEEPKTWTLEFQGMTQAYIQKPLSYFAKMEFFGLVGRTLDEAMEGEDGLKVNSLLDSNISSTNFQDIDSFLALAVKIAAYSEDFLKDCYVIWLGVPKVERAWAREALNNLTDEEGEEIIQVFIDQNWNAIERFFTEGVSGLVRRVQARRKKD